MKDYGKIERNQTIYALVDVLDAKTRLRFFDCDNNIVFDGYTYQLYDKNEYKDFIIDYIQFDSISKGVTCVIRKYCED